MIAFLRLLCAWELRLSHWRSMSPSLQTAAVLLRTVGASLHSGQLLCEVRTRSRSTRLDWSSLFYCRSIHLEDPSRERCHHGAKCLRLVYTRRQFWVRTQLKLHSATRRCPNQERGGHCRCREWHARAHRHRTQQLGSAVWQAGTSVGEIGRNGKSL